MKRLLPVLLGFLSFSVLAQSIEDIKITEWAADGDNIKAINDPDTVSASALLVYLIGNDTNNSCVTYGNGATELIEFQDGSALVFCVAYKTAVGDEDGGTWNLTFTSGQDDAGCSIAVSVLDAADPAVTPPEISIDDGYSQTPDPPSETHSAGAGNYLSLALEVVNDVTKAAGTTGPRALCGLASRLIAAATEDPDVFTTNDGNKNWTAGTLLIRAASTPSGSWTTVPACTTDEDTITCNFEITGGDKPVHFVGVSPNETIPTTGAQIKAGNNGDNMSASLSDTVSATQDVADSVVFDSLTTYPSVGHHPYYRLYSVIETATDTFSAIEPAGKVWLDPPTGKAFVEITNATIPTNVHSLGRSHGVTLAVGDVIVFDDETTTNGWLVQVDPKGAILTLHCGDSGEPSSCPRAFEDTFNFDLYDTSDGAWIEAIIGRAIHSLGARL